MQKDKETSKEKKPTVYSNADSTLDDETKKKEHYDDATYGSYCYLHNLVENKTGLEDNAIPYYNKI